jgi:competence protein ComEC
MLVFILSGVIFYSQNNQELRVIFLDVGQGDAILISQGSYQILVDGGRDGKLLLGKLGKFIPFWDRNIEVVLATHPDQDHIAGLIDVLKTYQVEKIIKTNAGSTSQTFKALKEAISAEKSEVIEAKQGTDIKFSDNAELKIIYPFSSVIDESGNQSNENSIVAKIKYGENSFFLTGDLPKTKEEEIISSGSDISAKVLKVAHHGSKYSTGSDFLEKVNPQDAVISVGKDNAYGHPNEETLNLLKDKNINILRTDERGDIIYNCDKNLPCTVN